MKPRYGIAEWYGEPFATMPVARRQELADIATDANRTAPPCPFKQQTPPCSKQGGVCSMQRFREGDPGRIGQPDGVPAITCPGRFDEGQLILHWLADIVGFDTRETYFAREVPFMQGTTTNQAAGMLDMVLVKSGSGQFDWYGVEIQAVYFSGKGRSSEYRQLQADPGVAPPFPDAVRRPDWRSSSAKRLMPQLQIKVPTLRMWGKKLAVVVDRPFFDAIGGPSEKPSQDLNEGEVLWLVPEIRGGQLVRGHWETLTLNDSGAKLLAAETVKRNDFENALEKRLRPLG